MKKMVLFLGLVLLLSLTACGGNSDVISDATSPSGSMGSSPADLPDHGNEDETSYAMLIPPIEDAFINGEITILDSDGGDMYALHVVNFTDEEYTEYVTKCKEYGFNDVSYDIEDERFGAYSSDGAYWVQVSKEADGTLSIICNKSKNR